MTAKNMIANTTMMYINFTKSEEIEYSYAFPEAKAILITLLVFSTFFVIFGFIGNALIFIVFSRSGMNESTLSVYSRFLAVADTSSIIFNNILMNYTHLVGFFTLSEKVRRYFSCATISYGAISSAAISNTLIVVMSLDRGIHIYFPTKAVRICTKLKARIISSIIVIIFLIFHHPVFYSVGNVEITVEPGNKWLAVQNCLGKTEKYHFLLYKVYAQIDKFGYSLTTCILVFFVNIFIIVHLFRAKERRKVLTSSIVQRDKHTNQMTVTLLFLSSYFLISHLPFVVLSIVADFLGVLKFSEESLKKYLIYIKIALSFASTNNCINFYIFVIVGSKFRQKLKGLFIKNTKQRKKEDAHQKNSISIISSTLK